MNPDREVAFLAHLVADGLIDPGARDRVLVLRKAGGERAVHILGRLGLIGDHPLAAALAAFAGLGTIALADFPADPLLTDRFTPQFLTSHRLVPLALAADGLQVAVVDPFDDQTLQALRLAVEGPIHLRVAAESDLAAALARLYGLGQPAPTTAPTPLTASIEDLERIGGGAGDAPVVRLVDGLIRDAIAAGATDLHLEPLQDRVQARLRVDGVLRGIEPPPQALFAAVISRIKIMARLNIAERRLPQDGRLRVTHQGREVELRVSTMPVVHGESVALRLLDREQVPLSLDGLGLGPTLVASLRDLLARPNGIILASGPTGSGKSTLLYALLSELNGVERKILTVEDPVERTIAGLNQIAARPEIGLDFARALRSILRQDPDVIMVGEIRDPETAQVAVQAALTGHLVLSTVHANSAAATVTRLLDMGVEPYLVTAVLNAVLSLRLVRKLCLACRAPDPRPEAKFKAVGCPSCGGTGYAGRTAIAELLPIDSALRGLIAAGRPATEIEQAARAGGLQGLREAGLELAAAGVTSLEEVLRTTHQP